MKNAEINERQKIKNMNLNMWKTSEKEENPKREKTGRKMRTQKEK